MITAVAVLLVLVMVFLFGAFTATLLCERAHETRRRAMDVLTANLRTARVANKRLEAENERLEAIRAKIAALVDEGSGTFTIH